MHLPDVDVRPDAGIVRSPVDEIKAIQSLLADVYKDAGDGRTLFRELVQNADDSGAARLELVVLERGWPDARNSLLRGPALLVANDGGFPDKDREALHKAIGGAKEDDVGKIGTFGIGLKSVFHLCEAFIYVGNENTVWRAGVLNPWTGTGADKDADPLHPDWNNLDVEQLRSVAAELFGKRDSGFLLWIPLRRLEHLDRGVGGTRYGLGEHCPVPDDLCAWFGRSAPAALLLAQCGYLGSIDTTRAAGLEGLRGRTRLVHVARTTAGWVGRHRDDSRGFASQVFEGEIESNERTWSVNTSCSDAPMTESHTSTSQNSEDRTWSVVGIEALGSDYLRQFRLQSNWPQSSQWRDGQHATVPRKALAHAAVTVLRPSDPHAELLGTRIRWAVFLPLDDDPEPRNSAIVERQGSSPAWEIILHGYFWPSQDRRSVPGVTGDIGAIASDADMRVPWNRALCERLLLPLLPRTLAEAVGEVEEYAARRLLSAVVRSSVVKDALDFVTQHDWLLPVVADDGIRWKAIDADACRVLSIPNWSEAPVSVRRQFPERCGEPAGDLVFVDHDAPRFAGELGDWSASLIESLLNCIRGDEFGAPQSLRWIQGVICHVLGPEASGEDPRAAKVAQWLAGHIGAGALLHTTRRSASRESRDELRQAWRDLCEALPKAWLFAAPVDTQHAVAELATERVLGKGLFPVPFGRRASESGLVSQLNQQSLDHALSTLGRRLQTEGDSERATHSRLLLAEVLLSKRDERPLGDLARLPLLRAIGPGDREHAWTIAELRRQVESCRVFANPIAHVADYEDSEGPEPERPSDPKRAVTELANALDETVWLVNDEVLGCIGTDAPSPMPEALANSVLRIHSFADAAQRQPLLMRLAPSISHNTNVRLAARVLLAGRAAHVVGHDAELFNVRDGNNRVMHILLRLLNRSWCAVQGMLVESLSQDTLDDLSVAQVDPAALHRLLCECLDEPVDWTGLNDADALQMLQGLYGATLEEQQRWRTMPLHRGVDGTRGAFGHEARRSSGRTAELRLPPQLESDVRLLDPDTQVAQLYDSVPEMDHDGLLRLMLENPQPWRFALQITRSVRASDGQVFMPQDGTLRELLRRSHWLPQRDGGAIAPDAVLVAPKELLDAVVGLAEVGAFGDKRLPDVVEPETWRTAEPVVREILGRASRERQVQRMIDALDSDQVAQVGGSAWVVVPHPEVVGASLIEDALETTLATSHAGWRLVHTVAGVLRHGESGLRGASETLVQFARALHGPVLPKRQIEVLKSLADTKPGKDSPSGRLFRRYLEWFVETNGFFACVLPELDLPTQDGNWHVSRVVARTETGVARRHRLMPELRSTLKLGGDNPVPHTKSAESTSERAGLDVLETYFEPWRGRVPHGAVGAFLSLLGDGLRNAIGSLAQQWLGEDVAIEPMEGYDPHAVSVWVSTQVAHGDRVSAVNVLGSWVEMEAEADNHTLFAIDPIRRPPSQYSALVPLGAFWEVSLRAVEPQNHSRDELMRLLGGTVERWAAAYLELPREQVNAWWSRWGKGSQADLGPVLASIKAHLPLTLQHLDVKESAELQAAVRKAERAQRRREQVLSEEALRLEREALDDLAGLIEEPHHQEYLWQRINALMRRYGYGRDSVLLELAQNADDALAEAAEIQGGALPLDSRRLLIRVHEGDDGRPTVDVMHWGRPINDTGGDAFPTGRDRAWDQDLYFMMLMNLSGKSGENPGESSRSSTTGRFGLGFKSVHLASSSPSVVSGYIAFSIAGGLLPQDRPVPDDADSWMVKGRQSTLVRLPLRRDVDTQTLIDSLFHRFAYAHVLLPVFSRQVREVVVEGGPLPGVQLFDGMSIDGAPGWSVGSETGLPNHPGRLRVFRFRPADAGQEEMGTAAIALGLREGVPTAFEPDVPFLWNVTPTSENWGCGYVVNGPFKLDPGRAHVSLDDNVTLRTIRRLGEALGRGLIELTNALVDRNDKPCNPLAIRRDFASSLWRVLACGLNNPDELRSEFLLELHGYGRGLSAWMGACSVVPSGLPSPFRPTLPPLTSGVRIEVANDDFDNDLCAILANIKDKSLVALVGESCIVSPEVEQLLRPLCSPAGTQDDRFAPTRLHPSDLFAATADQWDHCLTPERLHALRPINGGFDGDLVAYDRLGVTWRRALKARAVDGSLQPLRNLLLQDAPDLFDQTDAYGNDEPLRAAFAPANRLLDPAYIERNEDRRVFQWLRVQHRVDAATMAEWCTELPEDRHAAAIQYLLHGELGSGVLQRLVPTEHRPRWLREYDDVRRMLEDQCEESWRRQSLLGALFPHHFPSPDPQPDQSQHGPDAFFEQLVEWWDDETVRDRVITIYEKNVWPDWLRRHGIAEGLRSDSVDHWLGLLVLGACRGLGRTQDHQHRSFLELAHREGWWDVFKTPDDVGAWMGVLRNWQDDALAKLTYPRWMSLFPAIYQISRFLDVYVRLLKSAGQRPESMYSVTRLLAPRVDEALTGAGTHFDAPPAPLNMGLHWVIRELVRLKILVGEQFFPDCWVPSERVLRLLGDLGLDRLENGMSNSLKARAIFDFLAPKLGTEPPNLRLAFDIPLRHVASSVELRRQFGLETPDNQATSDEGRHRTSRGEMVRSKSEVIIANELFAKGIEYEYEAHLRLADGTRLRPDFTIWRPDGVRCYWEHLGMLDDLGYRKKWEDKLGKYRLAGILPVDEGRGEAGTLFITRDDQGVIDSQAIAEVIQHLWSFAG